MVVRIAVFVALLAACAASGRLRLDEAAALYHDDLRWSRTASAEGAVDPRMRAAYQQHHRAWGASVHLVDLEIEQIRVRDAEGTVRTRVAWIRGTDSTDLRESTVEEHWENAAGTWRLLGENVVAGDPGLWGGDGA